MSNCRIIQGDCRVLAHDIAEPINAIITDPPYGMAFVSGSAQTAAGKRWVKKIENDENPEAAIVTFLDVMEILVPKLSEQSDCYVFTRWNLLGLWIDVVNECKPLEVKNVLVWDKGTPGMGDIEANWAYSHELIIYAKKGRRPIPERRSSIIYADRTPSSQHFHPTQKPVELLEILVGISTNRDDLIVDPFAGSGSTIVAAHRLGRRGIGYELDAEHASRASQRLDQGVFPI